MWTHCCSFLQGRKIFCLNPKRIAIAGKIRVFCFDKTGTLTKEGLDFTGVQSVIVDTDGNGLSFGPLQTLEKENAVDAVVSMGLATCHAVTKFGDRLVGNQVEVSSVITDFPFSRQITKFPKHLHTVYLLFGTGYTLLKGPDQL